MADDSDDLRRNRFWIVVVAVVIGLIFLYYYQPFEKFVVEAIPRIHFSNAVFWFASAIGVIGYVVAHWSSFRRHIFRGVNELDVEALVFETLQVAILVAVIFCAGGMLQIIEMMGEHLVGKGEVIGATFGEQLLAIILLLLLAIVFYLLHHLVRLFRGGWSGRRQPPVRRRGGD